MVTPVVSQGIVLSVRVCQLTLCPYLHSAQNPDPSCMVSIFAPHTLLPTHMTNSRDLQQLSFIVRALVSDLAGLSAACILGMVAVISRCDHTRGVLSGGRSIRHAVFALERRGIAAE